jgi:hypothetical protein
METDSDNAPQGSEPGPADSGLTQDERTWALLSHVLSLVGGFVAPLVIWLVKKEDSAYVAEHALESLNFQITVTIAWLVAFALACIGGFFLLPVIAVYALVMIIIATLKASEGKSYQYPLTLRLIK